MKTMQVRRDGVTAKIYEVARITTGSVIITLLLSDKIYSVRNAYSGTLLN